MITRSRSGSSAGRCAPRRPARNRSRRTTPSAPAGFDTRVVPDDPAALDATVLDVGTDARPSGDEAAVEEAVHRGAADHRLRVADRRRRPRERADPARDRRTPPPPDRRARRRRGTRRPAHRPRRRPRRRPDPPGGTRDDAAAAQYFPPEVAATYRDAGLWGTRTIADEFHATATRHPHRDAVVAAQGRLTYAELDARTDRIAVGLADLGLHPGDPVIVQITNRLEAVVAWYALLKAGLVPVATLAAHRGHEIAHISRAVGARAHLVEPGTQRHRPRRVRPRAGPRPPDDAPRPRPRRPPGGRPRPGRGPHARRGDPARHRPRRRRRLPALRRHHRGPEADPAPARRVLVQRPRLRRGPRLDRRRPRRAPHPDHPQRRHRLRRPRPAQRRRVPRAHRPRPRHRDADPRRRAHHLGALRPRALPRAGPPALRRSSPRRCASSCCPARRSPRSCSRRPPAAARRSGSCSGWPRACSS